MKAFFALLIMMTSFAHAGTIGRIQGNPLMTEEQGIELLKEKLAGDKNRLLFNDGFKIPSHRGDFVILWGVGASTDNQKITEIEYQGLWRLMNYLSGSGFRVVMNVRATGADLKLAAETLTTSVILFSGHGNKEGFYDWDEAKVDSHVFENASKSLNQIILSSCHGRQALNDFYIVPKSIKTIAWDNLTNSTELLDFMVSDRWTGLEKAD